MKMQNGDTFLHMAAIEGKSRIVFMFFKSQQNKPLAFFAFAHKFLDMNRNKPARLVK